MSGILYTHTVEPLTTNFDRTPTGTAQADGDVKQLRVYNIEVRWDSNAIGEIAKQAGLQEVYYADLETLSILGIWTQKFAHVYGR
jgi:hypothetical protein